jgi:hypothetical protein
MIFVDLAYQGVLDPEPQLEDSGYLFHHTGIFQSGTART